MIPGKPDMAYGLPVYVSHTKGQDNITSPDGKWRKEYEKKIYTGNNVAADEFTVLR